MPDAFFKVVLYLEGTPKAIGSLFKNDPSSQSIKDRVCSFDSVEELTSLDFFHYMEDEIENTIEAKSELKKW